MRGINAVIVAAAASFWEPLPACGFVAPSAGLKARLEARPVVRAAPWRMCSTSEALAWATDTFPGDLAVVSPATRISGVLAETWEALADVPADEVRGRIIIFPSCEAVGDARGLQRLYEHLEVCQDVCDHFGSKVALVPHPRDGPTGAPAPALELQPVFSGGEDEFPYDPAWDGDWDIDLSKLPPPPEDAADGFGTAGAAAGGGGAATVPASDDEVVAITKDWVQAVITDMGVCPFSVDAARAGLPVGLVNYPVTRESTPEAVYREYWREVEALLDHGEKEMSTTLLVTPNFGMANSEAFDAFSTTLTQPLEILHLEDDIQLVFFHPLYTFRDGQARLGPSGAANFARRSPFPMINILRTKQVRLAQKSIPTGLVYKQNEDVLTEVGSAALQDMLDSRDWTGLEGRKVDRRRTDYYETARRLQGLELHLQQEGAAVAAAAETEPAPAAAAETEPVPAPAPAPAASSAVPAGAAAAVESRGPAALALAASSSEAIDRDDLKVVVAGLMKRSMHGLPLDRDRLGEMGAAVDRILTATAHE